MVATLILRWLLVGGQLVLAGVAAFVCLMIPPAAAPAGFERVTLPYARWIAAGIVVLSPLVLLGQTAAMAGVSWRAAIPLVPEVLRQTHLGRVWLWRLPVAAALIAPAFVLSRARLRMASMGALGVALIVMVALSGHAVDHGPFMAGLYVAHMMAASLWIGALLCFLIGAGGGYLSVGQSATVARRVSTVAGWCVAVLIVSGAAVAYRMLGVSLDHLLYSAYGRTLINKLCFAALAIGIGGYNRLWIIPKVGQPAMCKELVTNVAIETLILAGVLAWTVILSRTPPAH